MTTDPTDPLKLAQEALAKLKDADDWDEPTGRTEVNVTVKMPSQPEIEAPRAPDSKTPPAVKAVTAVMDRLPPTHRWIAVVLAAAVAALAGHQMGLW
jgi:hypothetical protein